MNKKTYPDIIFDCDKVRRKNTGLHTFIINLTQAISEQSVRRGYTFGGFCLETGAAFLGKLPIISHSFWHRIFLRLPKETKIWHVPFQFGKYFPMTNQKVVLTIHDLNFLYEKDGRKRRLGLAFLQRNINRADYLVAISEFTKGDILKHLDIGKKPLDVIYNGTYPILPENIDDSLNLTNREFLFTVSTVLPKKNFHVLPCLLVGNDYELIIAGNLSPYADVIMDEAVKYGVASRVRVIGPIEESAKNWYLKHCKAFVFPSIAEGFGIPVIEAMNFGKPVFLSKHTCLPEIGGEHCYYFNYKFDRELMQKEFREGLEHYARVDRRDQIIARSREFSWDTAASKYMDIYEKLMQDSN